VRPANFVFADEDRRVVKLTGFGSAMPVTSKRCVGGEPYYQPVEEWLKRDNDSQLADVWALGVTFCECLQGDLPWKLGASPEELFQQIQACAAEVACDDRRIVELIRQMITPEARRLSTAQLCRQYVVWAQLPDERAGESPKRRRVSTAVEGRRGAGRARSRGRVPALVFGVAD
jgi:serine/threonine protein kinase